MTSYAKCSYQEKAYVDKTASDMSKWAIAGEAQLDALRETTEARDAAIQRLVEAGIIDPTNRQWPKKEDAANYISYWSDVSAKTPTSTDELSSSH